MTQKIARYAEGTTVPVAQSRTEIERILARYGATKFMYGNDKLAAMVGFEANGRRIVFRLPLPQLQLGGLYTQAAVDREERRVWRSLVLSIKSKLEVVASGISSFESEFMPFIVMPNGQTVAEWMAPQIAEVYETGKMPPMLPMLTP